MNGFENIVENGAFACDKKMLHFPTMFSNVYHCCFNFYSDEAKMTAVDSTVCSVTAHATSISNVTTIPSVIFATSKTETIASPIPSASTTLKSSADPGTSTVSTITTAKDKQQTTADSGTSTASSVTITTSIDGQQGSPNLGRLGTRFAQTSTCLIESLTSLLKYFSHITISNSLHVVVHPGGPMYIISGTGGTSVEQQANSTGIRQKQLKILKYE